jgi:RNA polymerase sigma-70 factor (ECF subfamily)
MGEHHAQKKILTPEPNVVLDICRRVAEGDEDAQRRLMEILFNHIHRTASYLAGDLEDARDIAQTACVEVLLAAGSYRGDASLAYWADRVTLQTAAKILKKKTRRQRLRAAYFQPPAPVKGTDEHADRAEVRCRLTALLQALKLSQREVVLLRYVHGYTIKEAAELCGIPVETARGRLKKGRLKLKKKVVTDPLLKEWVKEWITK